MRLFRKGILPRVAEPPATSTRAGKPPRGPPNKNEDSKASISTAQTLNYDVLSAVYIWAKWTISPAKLASVCRNWREIALATPQIWTRISLSTSQNSEYIETYTNRSNNLPLDVSLSEDVAWKGLVDLPASRIVSLKITDCYRHLVNFFPLLERLELVSKEHDRDVQDVMEISFSLMDRFPKLRELVVLHVSYPVSVWVAKSQFSGFPPLQKLDIDCQGDNYWETIVDRLSKTLVSLHLRIDSSGWYGSVSLELPQLLFLRITEYADAKKVTLAIDAPLLESLDEGQGRKRWACTKLVLRHPGNVKNFHTGHFPVDLSPYTNVETLWFDFGPDLDVGFKGALTRNLRSCPNVTRIMYHDSARDWTRRVLSGNPLLAIQQLAGGSVTVERFEPSEMNLPGSMLHP